MAGMAEVHLAQNVQVRTVGGAKRALDVVVASLRSTGKLKFRGRNVTQEAVVNALWLAAADVDTVRLERWLAPYVEKLEAMLQPQGDAKPDVPGDSFPGSDVDVAEPNGHLVVGKLVKDADLSASMLKRQEGRNRPKRGGPKKGGNNPGD